MKGIDYRERMQDALRSMVAGVLADVGANGLPGDHHFLIAFDTTHPGVDMPDWLREQYPEEMQIVLQNWFADLAVMADRFSVTLSFNNAPQTLVVPLAALRSFVDPSVEFGMRFDAEEEDGGDDDPGASQEAPEAETAEEDAPHTGPADVVSLDKFRR